MILEQPKFDVARSQSFQESGFKIKASAKAFAILSSGLYAHKIRAIVRELGTNAADSHIVNGNVDVPFLVHLPNALEPYFSIRDYGTGLSQKDIESIYTTYFESNKTTSDTLTGCLGLGSKSPFSYTDNFTVSSYFDGAKHVYTAFIGENGCPSIALMTTEETNEPNGLEISFGVKSSDNNEFKREAQFTYKYFKVRPKIVGQQIDYSEDSIVFDGGDWQLIRGNSSVVTMGNVAYPLNLYEAGITNEVFRNYAIRINVKIGLVEMTASREALEYTKKTKQGISTQVNNCINTFLDVIKKQIEAKATYWEACELYAENAMFFSGVTLMWQGREVRMSIRLPKDYPCVKLDNRYGSVKVKRGRALSEINVTRSALYIVNDVKGAQARSKQYMANGHITKDAYLIEFADDAERLEFETAVGVFPADTYLLASSFPKPIYKKGGNATTAHLLTFNPRGYKATSSWEATDMDVEDGGVYVELEHWSPKGFGDFAELSRLVKYLEKLDIEVEIIGVRKKHLEAVKSNPDWQSFEDFLKDKLQAFKDEFELAQNMEDYRSRHNVLKAAEYFIEPKIKTLVKNVKHVIDNHERMNQIAALMLAAKIQVANTDVKKELREVMARYPLIDFMVQHMSYYNTLPANDIKDYIRLIDSRRANDNVF